MSICSLDSLVCLNFGFEDNFIYRKCLTIDMVEEAVNTF